VNHIRAAFERHFFLLLALVYLIKAAIRVAISPSLGWDEAELALQAQYPALGYGAQPPLYMWLQFAVFRVFGDSLPALVATKHVLMFGAHACLYWAARSIGAARGAAAWTSMTLFAVPLFAYEGSRDLSHSVLATTASAALVAATVRLGLAEDVRRRGYLMFGVAVGASLVSKYNLALLVVAVFVAAGFHPRFRVRLFAPGMLAAAAAALLVTAPHLAWIPGHFGPELVGKLDDMGMAPGLDVAATASTLGTMVAGVCGVVLPAVVIALAWLWPAVRRRGSPSADTMAGASYLVTLFAVVVVSLGIVLAAFGGGNFRDRWLLPLMVGFPVAFVPLWFRASLPAWRRNGFAATLLVAAAFQNALLVAPVLAPELKGKPTRLNLPVAAVHEALIAAGADRGTLVTGEHSLGGALKLRADDLFVVVPGMTRLANLPPPAAGPLVLVWEADEGREIPPSLEAIAVTFGYRPLASTCVPAGAERIEAPFTHWSGEPYRVWVAIVREGCLGAPVGPD